jgi:outer membrane protein OmpA-like peptidoglycan-associated protein
MKKVFNIVLSITMCLFFSLVLRAQDENVDAEGCKDHPMFNRMPNFYIGGCTEQNFAGYDFFTGKLNEESGEEIRQRVEGKYYDVYYYHQKFNETSSGTSALEIMRNYENALKKIGAKIIFSEANEVPRLTAVLKKDNMETWFEFNDCIDGRYGFVIVQKQIMEQVIQADEMYEALNNDGFISLDIHFDTGKSTILQESLPLIDQIYSLLSSNSGLNVSIEGHTDNVGSPESNKKLSLDRAKAVMDVLVAKGISKDRLSYKGFGQDVPIADNRTEAGRAKNRRVEIVKI